MLGNRKKKRSAPDQVCDYTAVFKRAKLGTLAWTEATAYYPDYVARRYRPAVLVTVRDAARRPWWAARFEAFEDADHAFVVLPGRLSAPMLSEVRRQLECPEESPGMNREEAIRDVERHGRPAPWLAATARARATRRWRRCCAANQAVDGINGGLRRLLGARLPAAPYFRLFWARKSAAGATAAGRRPCAPALTDAMRTPPDDLAKARACAAGRVDLAWMRGVGARRRTAGAWRRCCALETTRCSWRSIEIVSGPPWGTWGGR